MKPPKMDYTMRAQRLSIPKGRRVILTSDVHGRLSWLKGLLKKVSFSPEDYLIIAGDILEKGEESLSTLRYLMELERTGHVHIVYGNVDARVIEYLETPELFYSRYCRMMKNWGYSVYSEMLKEQGLKLEETGERTPQALEMEGLLKEEPGRLEEAAVQEAWSRICAAYERELAYIQGLPAVIDAGTFLVTHAGLPTEDYGSLSAEQVRHMVNWKSFQDEELYFSRYVFVGHWPVTIYEREKMDSSPLINRKKRIVSLDGGCAVKRDGQLNAMILPDIDAREFKIESFDDFPRARVQEDREGRAETFHIRWKERFVERIRREEEGSLVRVLCTGREHWIPEPYLWEDEDDGRMCCSDYTDAVLPLRAGDEVSVLGSYRRGYLVRKDGVQGWYDGRLTMI